VEGMSPLSPISTARSGTGIEGSGRQLSRPAERVDGLPWEMFDLGFHHVKGKGLMKTHLLKVRPPYVAYIKITVLDAILFGSTTWFTAFALHAWWSHQAASPRCGGQDAQKLGVLPCR
jgi:hypothetical protein